MTFSLFSVYTLSCSSWFGSFSQRAHDCLSGGIWKTTSLTVWVSEHNAGVLPSQLQSHSFQVAPGRRRFDQLAHLNTNTALTNDACTSCSCEYHCVDNDGKLALNSTALALKHYRSERQDSAHMKHADLNLQNWYLNNMV